MAQPGNFTPILLYGSSTPTNVPLAANLTNSATGSEIAINVADKNLFFKDSGGVVNTVPIRQSSTSSNGWLSSTDWNTFNNKQPSGAYLTAVTADAPLSGSGTAASHLVIATANTTTTGALSSTDWNTFNGKQAALVSGTNIKTVGGVTLLGSGDVGTIGTGYGGTGLTSFTANGVVYASSTSALTTGSALKFDGSYLTLGASDSRILGGDTVGRFILANSDVSTYAVAYGSAHATQAGTFWVVTNATKAFIFDASGNFKARDGSLIANNSVGLGNVTLSGSGVGVQFPATQSASSDVNTLDDYEEGTWTPVISANGSGSPTFTLVAASGNYTKIGRQVTITCSYQYSSIGTVGGSYAFMTGLPFTVAVDSFVNMTILQSAIDINQYTALTASTNRIQFAKNNYPGAAGAMLGTDFPAAGTIVFTMIYFA